MGTHYQGSTEEIRALNTFIKLIRAAETVSSRVHVSLASENLTVSQLGVLDALYHLGPLSQKEISQKILKSGGNITMVIDHLEKRGLVQRTRNQPDRRVTKVSLTSDGHQFVARILPGHVANIVREMKILTSQEQEQIGLLCRKLGTSSLISQVGQDD
ncbi:MAG: MarR family transcriptional regulator [Candidatus Brocadiae bacterium]|nr:MarR family transcriptional regulator [Candidatus Brocadiia bacterium]